MKKIIKKLTGIIMCMAMVIVSGKFVTYAATETLAPDGYYDLNWEYQYEVVEYGCEKLVGAFYKNNYYSYLYNENGIIEGMLDSEGNQVVKYSYDEFGIVSNVYSKDNGLWIENNNLNFIGNQNKMLYMGMYFDKETNCYYVNGRYFDPVANKYIDGVDRIDIFASSNPYLSIQGDVQIAGSVALETVAQQWANSLLASSSYGVPKTYSTNWYNSLSDVELLARAIYCEGGTAYTTEENAVAWVILNRVKSSSFPNTPSAVLKQNNQFASITGGSSATTNARQPSTSTNRWAHSTFLACLMLTTTSTTEWNRIVGSVLNGQLCFYSYTTAKNQYTSNVNSCVFKDSGSSLLYNDTAIQSVYVLGYGNVSSFARLFSSYSPTVYSRNIYYNYK